jgi:hypothetical protein
MRTDTAFSQATITVLVATMLALMLQARLIGSHADHPISTRGRAALAAVELFLTTTLSIVAVLVAFVLMRHLATGGPPLKPAYRHAITLLLLLPLTGLGVIAVLNRMVPYVWKSPAPERPYLEPQVDTDLLGGLVVSVLGASAAAASLLELSGQLGAQWLCSPSTARSLSPPSCGCQC